MSNLDHEKSLERFVDSVLREQPLQPAPRTLVTRVFAEIEQREARAWWESGFQAWPVAARVAFCVASFALIAFAIELPQWLGGAIDMDTPMSVSRGMALWQALMTIGSSISNSIPAQWTYAVLAVIAAMYATCFGAGAAAYRALLNNH